MNEIFRIISRGTVLFSMFSLFGCAAIRDHFAWRELRRSDRYAIGLILSRRPDLQGTHFTCQKTQWHGEARLENVPYFYAIVRYARDRDSDYRIFIVEQRISSPDSMRRITLRTGHARDYWHRRDSVVRELRHVILSPKSYKPTSE